VVADGEMTATSGRAYQQHLVVQGCLYGMAGGG